MAQISVQINHASIERKFRASLKKKGEVVANKLALNIFKRAYGSMLREFDSHPITLELRSGSRAINFSNTLDGYGNLFAYIGFEAGTRPIEPLRDLLVVGTSFRPTIYKNLTWYYLIKTPTKDAIRKVTPMPWEIGNSWVDGVERGMSNLSFFLYKRAEASRSKQGIQTPFEINDDLLFRRAPYVTEIFENFRERINDSTIR